VALLLAAISLLTGAVATLLVLRDEAPAASTRSFEYFDGSTGSFADYRGRPLVVNFWASTCVPCVTEMPAFEQVHQELGDGVAFLGLDVQERVDEGMELVERTGVTYDLASDFEGFLLAESTPLAVLPSTLFIDAEGRLVLTHAGALDAAQLRALIEEHLGR
jgi:thiol-disulfide isomerase/thioredoxin